MVAIPIPGGQFPVPNGAVPCEGTKAFPFSLDFTGAANAYRIDLTTQYNQKQFTTLQTIYADNSANTSDMEIICQSTNQVIVVAPLTQGYYTILQPSPPVLQVQTNGAFIVQVILLNFYIPPTTWTIPITNASGLPEVDVPALDAVIVGGLVQVAAFAGTVTAPSDASGTITVGGTRQVLFAANATRKRFIISNPSTAIEVLQFSYVSNTGGLIDLPPGTTWNEADLSVSGDEIWIVAPTTAHAFTAYAW